MNWAKLRFLKKKKKCAGRKINVRVEIGDSVVLNGTLNGEQCEGSVRTQGQMI